MKTLYLMRHAKSSWDDPELADFDRPLNEYGLRAAPFMGKLMLLKGLVPYVILSSPASRAKETARLVKKAANLDCQTLYKHRIYEASARTLREVVAETDDLYLSAMIVGHNPGMEGLIYYLTGLSEKMPTGAMAVLELDVNKWCEVTENCAKLDVIYRPRDEMDDPVKNSA